MSKEPDLDSAYALSSAEDARKLYAGWAETYDSDFYAAHGFRTPGLVADMYKSLGGQGPVLDVGAGTGLLGEALAAAGIAPVDGIDLSADMLAVAARKSVYRHLATADVTQTLPLEQRYAGIVSSGTFTLGHVGPEGLGPVLAVAEPGARVLIGMNKLHFDAAGFRPALADMGVADLTLTEHRIYAHHLDPAHRDDMGLILSFTNPGVD